MDLNWLADFLALNENRSFSRAADRRHLTQPAFSRRIQALEQWAGASLFERTSRSVTLTEAGRRFLPWAETLRRQADEARADVRAASAQAAEPLRIAATHSLSLTFFSHWIGEIGVAQSPGTVQLASESLDGCERRLTDGRAQFLLAHSHPGVPVRLDRDRFRSISVGADALVPVASPAVETDIGGLRQSAGTAPFVGYSDESGLGRILAYGLENAIGAPAPRPVFTSHHAGVLKAMACGGQGFAWLPRSIMLGELARGELVEVAGPDWAISLDIRLFRPRARLRGEAEAFWTAATNGGSG